MRDLRSATLLTFGFACRPRPWALGCYPDLGGTRRSVSASTPRRQALSPRADGRADERFARFDRMLSFFQGLEAAPDTPSADIILGQAVEGRALEQKSPTRGRGRRVAWPLRFPL